MSDITLNLVVVQSPDIARCAAFYSRIGLKFSQHRHGSGPEHFSAELAGGGVFELYPLSSGAPTIPIRIGFRVPSVELAVEALQNLPEAIVSAPRDSEWGLRAIVSDPDGNKVELLQA